jgi:hypothetical protein
MRSRTAKIFIVLVGIIFFTDAIDGDIAIAGALNALFHTSLNAISRDLVEESNNHHNIGSSTRTIASTNVVAQDEDSPTTLDTAFPNVQSTIATPKTKVVATTSSVVKFTYLTLHTLLI